MDHEILAGFKDFPFGFSVYVLGPMIYNILKYDFGFFPIAFKRNTYLHFIPDVVKSCTVVNLRFCKNLSVGQMDDASGTLVRFNPVVNFQDGKLEQPDINNIACMLSHLYPVDRKSVV